MLSKRHLEQLKKQAKRRARRPIPKPGSLTKVTASGNLERRMVNQAQGVLQNIEFGLVSAFRESEEVDDRIVDVALRAAIRETDCDDPHARRILEILDELRHQRADVPDEVWRDGLRVVLTSVRRHSACRAGETDYFDFVSEYIL